MTVLVLLLLGCATPQALPLPQRALPACPPTPNCVSSELGTPPSHAVDPLPARSPEDLADAVRALGCVVGEVGDEGVSATCRTRVFRFVDDLTLRVDAEAGVTRVRSASRVGTTDFGVNRRRVERLRALLER